MGRLGKALNHHTQEAESIRLNRVFHYAKSARFNLHQMLELPKDHPEIYASFKDHGYHATRCSKKYWAGIWSDLVVKQVLMRFKFHLKVASSTKNLAN